MSCKCRYISTIFLVFYCAFCLFTAADAADNFREPVKTELFVLPLGQADSSLGIVIEKGFDAERYIFPASIAVRQGLIYVTDCVSNRIIGLNDTGDVVKKINLPEPLHIVDSAMDSVGNLYLLSYYGNKLFIYNTLSEKFIQLAKWNRPHIIEIYNNVYYVIDFDPKTEADLRNQSYTPEGCLLDSKSQYTLDLDLYKLYDLKGNTISFETRRTEKDQVVWDYQVCVKNSTTTTKFPYKPLGPAGLFYKNIRILGFTPANRLAILIQVGPTITPGKLLSEAEVMEKTETYVDMLDLMTGQKETFKLAKDYTLYGPGITAHRFVLDEWGNIYQAQITASEFKVLKYSF